jgi:hypothetical protein
MPRSNDVERSNTGQLADAESAIALPAASLTNLEITYLPPERLRPAVNNARAHSTKQLKKIARSIERFGFVNPVLISDDGEIIAGHGRVEAAKMLGLRKVPTVCLSNLSPADRRAYVIADNRLAELAGWEHALLANELKGLIDIQFEDIGVTGFSLDAIDLMLEKAERRNANKGERKSEAMAADPQDAPVSKSGDVWLLGPHRLHCGSEPLDCDVIIRRWEQFTKKTARLSGTDLTFAEVAAARVAGEANHTRK